MEDIFDQKVTPEITAADLVGEANKYKTVDDLAKSVVYGQNHILSLETELKQLREELKSRQTAEDLLNKIKTFKSSESEQDEQPIRQPVTTEPGVTKQDVERLFQERELQAKQTSNLNTVITNLREKYGDQTASMVNKKAQELGLTGEELRDMARSKPQIVLGLFTEAPAVRQNFQAPSFNQKPAGFNDMQHRGELWSDFQKFKKDNPKEYAKPDYQRRIFKAAEKAMNEGWYDQWKNS